MGKDMLAMACTRVFERQEIRNKSPGPSFPPHSRECTDSMPAAFSRCLQHISCAVNRLYRAGLADLTEAELTAVMGGVLAAKKLRDWLDAPFPHL